MTSKANVKGPVHGLYTTYTNWRCRCDQCRAANASYMRVRVKKRRAALARMGYNVTSRPRRKSPLTYPVGDVSRAVVVKKTLPKLTKSA